MSHCLNVTICFSNSHCVLVGSLAVTSWETSWPVSCQRLHQYRLYIRILEWPQRKHAEGQCVLLHRHRWEDLCVVWRQFRRFPVYCWTKSQFESAVCSHLNSRFSDSRPKGPVRKAYNSLTDFSLVSSFHEFNTMAESTPRYTSDNEHPLYSIGR